MWPTHNHTGCGPDCLYPKWMIFWLPRDFFELQREPGAGSRRPAGDEGATNQRTVQLSNVVKRLWRNGFTIIRKNRIETVVKRVVVRRSGRGGDYAGRAFSTRRI